MPTSSAAKPTPTRANPDAKPPSSEAAITSNNTRSIQFNLISPASKRFPRQDAVRFAVFFAGPLHHFGRQGGRRWALVPMDGFQVVPHVLLVEGGLRAPRLIARTRPEA